MAQMNNRSREMKYEITCVLLKQKNLQLTSTPLDIFRSHGRI
jgi:hypothetical protein